MIHFFFNDRYDKVSGLLQVPLYCIFKDLLSPRPVQLTAHEREYAELICSRIMTLGEMHGKFEIPISEPDWDNAKRRFDPEGDRSRRSAGLADLRQFLIDIGELNLFYVHEDPTKKGARALSFFFFFLFFLTSCVPSQAPSCPVPRRCSCTSSPLEDDPLSLCAHVPMQRSRAS